MCIDREEILAVYEAGPEAVVELVTRLLGIIEHQSLQIAQLEERVRHLEEMLEKNSRNSSKPPSTDSYARNKPTLKSQRKKTNKHVGGQNGHPGTTLRINDDPDEVIVHPVNQCVNCGRSLASVPSDYERRQVFDIPPITINCIEHRCEIKTCPKCSHVNKALFPDGVTQPTQYGHRVKSFAVYLHTYQLLPYQRVTKLFSDILGCKISPATLVNTERSCFEKLGAFENTVKHLLKESPVINLDETGMRINAVRNWLHVAGTDKLTYYFAHRKRGSEAMDAMGILPGYTGVATHDFWKPYNKYECQHSLCNAHLLRELTGASENSDQQWPKIMSDLLICIKHHVDNDLLDTELIQRFSEDYDHITCLGVNENPPDPESNVRSKKRGRKKQTTVKNLLDRFIGHKEDILRFMYDQNVPFDNNQAERDIRMTKVQQKISGTFRSEQGAKNFCRIRGYVSTVNKNSESVIDAISAIFYGNSFVPKLQN
ncbi:IS66 family transposase [Methanolobus sp. ZRKC5]|uniref:IS66 family transposase n=1 Tax=Methanolobus sp. ZRKC5 TaxID=3136295 RepID=UPI00313D2B3C